MSFVLSKLLWIVVTPGHFLMLALVTGVMLQRWRGERMQRWGRQVTLGVASILLGFTIFPVDQWLIQPLEHRFPIPVLPDRVDGIIVLGGMVDTTLSLAWGRPKLNHEADRLTEFVYLAHRYPQARLVFSGGSGALGDGGPSEASVAREILSRLDLSPTRVLFEDQSRNTYENVLFSHQMVQPKASETWVLITSAALLPRTIGLFRKVDWPVIPYPVAFRAGREIALPPSLDLASTLCHFDEAIHEWLGLLAYWLMGRTDDWFPNPGYLGAN
ncbi:Membrane protein [Gammaproteobacteria bacterium]